jgi:ABC-type multidrug transport system ATPase subunit
MSNIFEADSIRKSFDNKQILTDIYIKCQTGDIIGLLGLNGSGKSTMLKILYGTLYTDYKHLKINGEIVEKPYTQKKMIGFLHQDNFLPKNLTIKRILSYFNFGPRIYEFQNDPIISKIYNSKIQDISGGESRYLEVKLILSLDKKFVFLDEPFNGISPVHTEIIKDLIRCQSKSKGVILTDHDYRNVLDVANKYMMLHDGGLKIVKSKEEFIYWGYLPDK